MPRPPAPPARARRRAPALAGAAARAAGAAALALGALLGPEGTAAQVAPPGVSCAFEQGTRSLNSLVLAGGARITYVGSPRIRCSDGVRIRADSAVAYSSQNMSHLIGNVRYFDDTRTLDSDEARYFSQTGRLQASGSVILRDETRGTEIRNGDLVYLRQTSYRDTEEITVTTGPDGRRPRALLRMGGGGRAAAPDDSVAAAAADALADTTEAVDSLGVAGDSLGTPPDSAAPEASPATDPGQAPDTVAPGAPAATPAVPADTLTVPTEVEADRLFLVGDGFFRANGNVVIDRDSLRATSDSATYDDVAERMLLQGRARVVQADFDLQGRDINVAMPGGEITSIRARREAVLTGQDLNLTAPLIDIFMEEGAMDRLVATRLELDPEAAVPDSSLLAQPVATAETFVLRADSLDVRAPGQVLDRIYAVGRARGDSSARDSLNVDILPPQARTDWMEGDTVIARFSPAPRDTLDVLLAPDTARREYVLEELVAAGTARSLYRLLPSDSTSRPGVDPPAVHYVTGARIAIAMRGGEVELMDVTGPTRGWHLEPTALRAAAADTTTRADTLGLDSAAATDTVPPDTAGAGGADARDSAPRRPDTPGAPNAAAPAAGPRTPYPTPRRRRRR